MGTLFQSAAPDTVENVMKTRSQGLLSTKAPKIAQGSKKTAQAGATRKGAGKPLRTGTRRRVVVVGPVKAPANRFKGFSHLALNAELRKVGITMAGRARGLKVVAQIPIQSGYNAGKVRVLLQETTPRGAPKGFGDRYRRIHTEQDELLSTSATRELMVGLAKNGAIPAKHLDEIESVFENISRVRFPTAYTGIAGSGGVMQHPTSGTGIFGNSKLTMKEHNALDVERKQEVAQAMIDEAALPNATTESIANAGLRTAIAFSLNNFIAPSTAGDVKPYLLGGKSNAELKAQVEEREKLKDHLVKLGGVQETGNDMSMGRKWGNRKGLRSASPKRI